MDNEKILILKMLEEKKITAEEAARLLEAADGKNKATESKYTRKEPSETRRETGSHDSYSRYARRTTENNSSNNSNSNGQRNTSGYQGRTTSSDGYSTNFEDLANDISKKIDVLAKDFEPKFAKFTEKVVETTASMADKISKSIQSEFNSSGSRGSHYGHSSGSTYHSAPSGSSTGRSPVTGLEQKNVELKLSGNENQLKLSALNGDISVKGYNGDKITAKIYFKRKVSNAAIDFIQLGNKFLMDYNEDEFSKVSIDAFVPESMFESIMIDTVNGKINASTLDCGYLVIENSNSETELSDIFAENIKIDCNNNLLKLDNVSGNVAKIDNFNGNITIYNLDIEKLKLDAFNSNIAINIINYNRYEEYMWEIESSNGRINLNLPTAKDLGYYLNARTTLANIKIGLINLNYLANGSSFVEARSIDYDSARKHVLLRLETSNSPIVIN